MNNHATIQKLLAAYCSDDLPENDRRAVELHLTECPACRAHLADLATTLRLMRTTPEVDPPPWLTARIMAHLREEKAATRSWLQRIWLPMHPAFPVKILALLVVCVSGYYLTRTMETELKQTSRQEIQELPAQTAPAPLQSTPRPPTGAEKPEPLRAAPPQTTMPPAAVPQPPHRQQDLPAGSPPPVQSAPAPQTFAPAPPVNKDDYGGKAESMKSAPTADSSNHAREAAPEMKSKSSRGLERSSDSAAPSATGRAAGTPAAAALPQVMLRLQVNDPAAAPARIREAVLRSGGSITDERRLPGQRLIARLPAARQGELLDRLQGLGRITERPVAPAAGVTLLEMVIQW